MGRRGKVYKDSGNGRLCGEWRVWRGGGEGGGVVGKGLGGSGERYATTKCPPFSDNYQSEADIHSHSCNPMWPESLLKANTSGF